MPLHSHIELRPTRDGEPCAYVAGTRVRVRDIYVLSEVRGKTPDEITGAFPHLTLAQVHSALAYSFENREEIVRQMHADEQFVEQLKAVTGPGPLARKLGAGNGGFDSLPS